MHSKSRAYGGRSACSSVPQYPDAIGTNCSSVRTGSETVPLLTHFLQRAKKNTHPLPPPPSPHFLLVSQLAQAKRNHRQLYVLHLGKDQLESYLQLSSLNPAARQRRSFAAAAGPLKASTLAGSSIKPFVIRPSCTNSKS